MVTSIHRNRTIGNADGIEALRCNSRSGYRNVYWVGRDANGVDVFKGRVKVGGKLRDLPNSRSTEPRRVARHVVAWCAKTFGPGWAELVRNNGRKHNPWHIWYSASRGGYLARVWVRGSACEVVPLTRGRAGAWRCSWKVRTRAPERPRPRVGARHLVFPTRAAARRGLKAWVLAQYGTRAVMFRKDVPASKKEQGGRVCTRPPLSVQAPPSLDTPSRGLPRHASP